MTEPAPRRTDLAAPRRWIVAVLLLLTIVAGLGSHAWLPSGAVSDIAGDALYAIAAYLVVVLIAPRLPVLAVGGIALAWCVAVEFFQLSELPLRWGAAFPPARLLFGSAFDVRDLLVYAIAVAAASAVDVLAAAAHRR